MFAVAGVTGNTGKVVADTLLAQGHAVRVIVRDAQKGKTWSERGAELAVAELSDSKALEKALTGVRGAYLLVPPQYGSNHMLADQAKVVSAIASAVGASLVPHVVLLSSIGAQHEAGTGPIKSLHGAEQALFATQSAVTSLRAAYFMENWGMSLSELAQGKLGTFLRTDLTIPMIATRDIGLAAARALVEGPRGKDIIELSGPSDYSPQDVAAALSKLSGLKVSAGFGPDEVIVGALTAAGLTADVASLFREMYQGINNSKIAFAGSPARSVRGQTPIEDVLRALLG